MDTELGIDINDYEDTPEKVTKASEILVDCYTRLRNLVNSN